MLFNRSFVEKTLSSVKILYDSFPQECSFSVDSRSLVPGEIFVALPGNQIDGHAFVVDALINKGAAGALICSTEQTILNDINQEVLKKKLIIVVDNVLESLMQLAKAWRAQFSYPVVGVTGSIGKTTTREIIKLLVQKAGKSCVVSQYNYNSAIGLSLSIMRMRSTHDVAVFEVGISKRNEMGILADILRPDIGVITTIAHSHVEGLGSLDDIATEKRLIFKHFKDDNIGIVQGDQPLLGSVGYAHPVVKFGTKTINQIQARKIKIKSESIDFVLKIYREKFQISLPTNHIGFINNVLAAVAVGKLLNIDNQIIVDAIQTPVVVAGRYQRLMMKDQRGIVIDDSYNASPESTKAALLAFEELETSNQKIVILGDLLELGAESIFWHRQLGRFLRKTTSIQRVIFVGSCMKHAYNAAPTTMHIEHVETATEALPLIQNYLKQSSATVLIKGSRGVNLSYIVDMITDKTITFAGATRIDEDITVESRHIPAKHTGA